MIEIANIVLAILFRNRFKKPHKYIIFGILVVAIGLDIGTLVNVILAACGIYACSWVAMGLGIGCTVFNIADLILILTSRISGNVETKSTNNNNAKKVSSMNYIDEIRQLKELLDNGALTQEEFDKEKERILNNKF